jgi:CMD domain protein
MTHSATTDVIGHLAGIAPGSHLDQVRANRPQAVDNVEKSYRALFEPRDFGSFTAPERWAIASFVAAIHREPATTAFYADELRAAALDIADIIASEGDRASDEGPYGLYPEGPLQAEVKSGPIYHVGAAARATLGERLAAALAHAHLLVFHPRDADPDAMRALHQAGWSTGDIVTLSQLVAFLSFQIRLVIGLRELSASRVTP